MRAASACRSVPDAMRAGVVGEDGLGALALVALAILALQSKVEDDVAEHANHKVGEHHRVSKEETRRRPARIDVGRDSSVDVTKRDDDGSHDGSHVGTLAVTCHDGNRVWDHRVDAKVAEPRPALGVVGNENDVADRADGRKADRVERPARGSVGTKANDYRDQTGHDVDRHRDQVGLVAGVFAERADDGWCEERKCVKRTDTSDVCAHTGPDLPVEHDLVDIVPTEAFAGRRELLIALQTVDDRPALRLGQEGGRFREVDAEPEAEDAGDDSGKANDNQDPTPPAEIANASHLVDGEGEEAAEGARCSGGAEEDTGSETELVALVPTADEIVATREKASFGDAQEETREEDAGVVVYKALREHADADEDGDDGEPDGWAKTLQEHVARHLEERVGEEEDGESHVVLLTAELEFLLETVETGVADGTSVEEAEEVQDA
ncbi:hypothetical protein L1887_62639 [Cichorium endivia]|nr:hypothetical protein L1887_62639 [Cichorium endivia]